MCLFFHHSPFFFLVPDEIPFVKWAASNGFPGKSFKELCADAAVCKAVQKVLEAYGRQNDLKGFENVKAVYLDTELFSADNGILTPTFKLKVWFFFYGFKFY